MDESISSVLNEMPTGEARTATASDLHGPLEALHDVVIQFGHRQRTTPRGGAGSHLHPLTCTSSRAIDLVWCHFCRQIAGTGNIDDHAIGN